MIKHFHNQIDFKQLYLPTTDVHTLCDSHVSYMDSERSDECIDFTMMCVFLCLCAFGFRWKSEYPWCIIEVKSLNSKTNHCKYLKFTPNAFNSVIYIHQNIMTFLSYLKTTEIFDLSDFSFFFLKFKFQIYEICQNRENLQIKKFNIKFSISFASNSYKANLKRHYRKNFSNFHIAMLSKNMLFENSKLTYMAIAM
ncbi:Uncharacterized protein FWK35_00022825 [Aphis craccivora]|uniref:Uncharacterized protein n=1 Tax=Aphis craccivora TaxID=307492 RepID=A0A6G0XA15_APHCR|nr:Uncharacterized protein FWK35_00022825 [Aphis craccivora]